MTEKITTPAELDALPVGSVVRVTGLAWPRPGVAERVDPGWQVTGMYEKHVPSPYLLAGSTCVATVLFRPDAPAPAVEDREALDRAADERYPALNPDDEALDLDAMLRDMRVAAATDDPADLFTVTQEEVRALLAEVDRLRAEGTPGVMHVADRAFYDVAIRQRDSAWRECERLRAALTPARPTCCDPTTVRECIDGHHLVEEHQHHTCGAGPGSGAGHEPGCGLVPLVDLRGLPGWDALMTTARRDALTEAADALEAMVGDDGPGNRNTGYGQAGLHIIARLRDRAAQEEGR